MHELVRKEMKEYYETLPFNGQATSEEYQEHSACRLRRRIFAEMDAFYAENPDMPSVMLKSRLHTLIAKYFEPVIFMGDPFFFEMGMRERNSWGLGYLAPSHWMHEKYGPSILKEHPIVGVLEQYFADYYDMQKVGLCSIQSSFDIDHHSLGYTTLFASGFNGLLEQIRDKAATLPKDCEQYWFCKAAEESCIALMEAASRFADRAEQLLPKCRDEKQLKYMTMLCKAARKLPANPPETFYEGLAMLLYTREAIATMENIGISQLGHLDRLLGELYEKDLREGRICEEEARELLGIWMLHTDIKFDLENSEWPETSTCIQLGGCDVYGSPVFNQVTRMVVEEHRKLGLVNPKLNCRYSAESCVEYLKLLGEAILAGHNNFVLINDEIVVTGLMQSGVKEQDARMYVSGGCQETMIEGFGHTEGAAIYVSVPKTLELFLNHDEKVEDLKTVEEPQTFEEFYSQYLAAVKFFFDLIIGQRNVRQQFRKKNLCCPLFSATQTGCIEKAKDYVEGGARYNFSTVALVGLGTVTDSLYAVKSLVYDQKKLTLTELCKVLAMNWDGNEILRQTAIALPKYGHNDQAVDALADRFLKDLTSHIRGKKNERGGNYIPSLFVYYHFKSFAGALRATPDGRKAGDLISPGCAPSQLKRIKDITMPLKTMQHVDFTCCGGGSAVLDVKLPSTNNFTPDTFAAFVQACGKYKCPTLQPNVVSQKDLLDARINPDKHKNLVVRISGLSAFFVALTPEVQDEIIKRDVYQV